MLIQHHQIIDAIMFGAQNTKRKHEFDCVFLHIKRISIRLQTLKRVRNHFIDAEK